MIHTEHKYRKTRLSGLRFGHTIYIYREVDSTQNKAMELARQGAKDGIVIVATTQIQGRGRESKFWISDKGGLYFSIIYRPQISLTDAISLTKTIGLVIKRVIEKLIAKFIIVDIKVKGINDLLLNNRKFVGILTETVTSGSEPLNFYVIGIGVNINQKHFPRHYESIATSLKIETSRSFSRYKILKLICAELEKTLPK